MDDKAKIILKLMLEKKHVYLFNSMEEAMKQIANIFKYKTFLIPDQCYHPSYRLAESYNELKTIYGIVDTKDLISKCQNKMLIVNGMASYLAEQSIDVSLEICKEKNCIIINDVSGTLTMHSARLGDFAIGSFDKESLLNLGYGAFFASNSELNLIENFDKSKLTELYEKFTELDNRVKYLAWLNNKVKTSLKGYELMHKDRRGINLLVRFDSLMEKRKIIKYCDKNQLPYTVSPKYLKSNPNLISIDLVKK